MFRLLKSSVTVNVNPFLVPGRGPYLLTHSVGCLPRVAREAVESSFMQPWAERGGDAWPAWLQRMEDFRSALAALFGGIPAEYCAQTNISSGLVKILSALPQAPADKRTLLAAEDTFPSVGFVLSQAQRCSYLLRLMPREHRPDDIRAWSDALTSDVRAVLVTHVHSNTGRVAPVAAIAKLCAERDILCIVDVAQSAGILPLSYPALGAHVVLGSCIKWLCGGPGAGFMWIRQDLIEALEPVDVGWFSHADPFEMDIHSFRYADDARRFWGGTPSIAPYVIAAAALRLIREMGVDAILAHNRRLVQAFTEELPSAWRARLPTWPVGGTLCVPLGAELKSVVAALNAAGVQFDCRGDVIRISFHACNSVEDAIHVARVWRGDR
jgi:selenocysteine lyase/cysteine desulfurase